ncbi:hypothetical protein AB1N83_008155 [Pleurotus pulmonarius]
MSAQSHEGGTAADNPDQPQPQRQLELHGQPPLVDDRPPPTKMPDNGWICFPCAVCALCWCLPCWMCKAARTNQMR